MQIPENTLKVLFKLWSKNGREVNIICPMCSGKEILVADIYDGYSVEIDAELGEMTVWQGDTCLTTIPINCCPKCGEKK